MSDSGVGVCVSLSSLFPDPYYLLVRLAFGLVCSFRDRVSCSRSLFQTHFVAKAGLELWIFHSECKLPYPVA